MNPETLVSVDVAATPDMVLKVQCTGARVGTVWKVGVPCISDGAVGGQEMGQEMGQEGIFLLPDVRSQFCLLEGPASELA